MPTPSSRDKVRAHRAALRAQGLRPIQLWVPDTRTPEFKAEAARQCRNLDRTADERSWLRDMAAHNAALLADLPEEPDGWFDDPTAGTRPRETG